MTPIKDTGREALEPCRKCGGVDVSWWNGRGTQANLYCNGCGQEEGVQVIDLFKGEVKDRPMLDASFCYPPGLVAKAREYLASEWNTRAPSVGGVTVDAGPSTSDDMRKALEPFVALLAAIECTTNHPVRDQDTWSCPDDAGIVTIAHLRALQKIYATPSAAPVDAGVREATPEQIENGCRGMYGPTWDGPPEKMPAEKMKDVWRGYAKKCLSAVLSSQPVLAHTPTSDSDVHPDIAEALTQSCEYFENLADVNDGDYGVPEPNKEMRLAQMCSDALDQIPMPGRSSQPVGVAVEEIARAVAETDARDRSESPPPAIFPSQIETTEQAGQGVAGEGGVK